MDWIPTRAAGLEQLHRFLPAAGIAYASTRNHDHGPRRTNVSQLSPWLHAGLLGEREVLAAVLAEHTPDTADSLVSEVFWRLYFKGYLEQRPAIWTAYCQARDAALVQLARNTRQASVHAEATQGRTGIAAFDHWTRELVATGYLHNHARMWFASIWIFTLRLPWQLGADFFLRHLMDGDAASNTLSWRWVGGLHTAGKTYLATADNISRYTEHHPDGPLVASGLAKEAEPLAEPAEHPHQPLALPTPPTRACFAEPYALLLHDEGASHAPLSLPCPPALVIAATRPAARSPDALGEAAHSFARSAVERGATETSQALGCDRTIWAEGGPPLTQILAAAGLKRLATAYLPIGWTRDALSPQLAPLADRGDLIQILPDLSRATWPLAKAGFFRVKKQIPALLHTGGIG